jgi:uncharacterized protein YcgI (DUF1989 family)
VTPEPSYVAGSGSPLLADPELYGPIAAESDDRQLIDSHVIPVRSGLAFEATAGSIVRFSIIEGPQVLDVNLWHRWDPRERFWAARTRQFHGAHVTTGHRLWSTLPFLRPLATIVADTLDYGLDQDGAGCHDLLGTRCDPYVNQLLSGTSYDFHCHSNLVRAVMRFGLTEYDVHDVINVFQVTGLMPDDERYFMKACPARVGDFFEIFCEIDLLVAASTCPGGDLSVPLWGPAAGAEPICNPILAEIFRVPDRLLGEWRPPERATYAHLHGLRADPSAGQSPPPLNHARAVGTDDQPAKLGTFERLDGGG